LAISNSPEGSWETFLQLENFTFAKSTERKLSKGYFVWKIQVNVYLMDLFHTPNLHHDTHHRPESFPLGLPPRKEAGCQYSRFSEPSIYVSRVVDEILLQHDLIFSSYERKNPIVGVLHLRRGDAKESCDTSPEKVKSFLECSFANTRDLANFTLLLSTDEQDPEYINEILTLPNKCDAVSHVKIQWLDHVIRDVTLSLIQSGRVPERLWNNYFTFFVSQRIWERTRFSLIRRRKVECHDCKSVRELIAGLV
jgi:hypothetical protein